jgi:hypothetical protein
MIRMRLNLIKDIRKCIYFDEIRLTLRLWTERASQIAYARNFNVKLLELLHGRTPFLVCATMIEAIIPSEATE